ncbi:hypothetical protein BC628DRAFT_1335374 [Trametes gibbosa]|nr:hypothetical protein BC628DRAFT_1335374 [Trametes gibbosa]
MLSIIKMLNPRIHQLETQSWTDLHIRPSYLPQVQHEELMRWERELQEMGCWERDTRYHQVHNQQSLKEQKRWHCEMLACREHEEREHHEQEEYECQERQEHKHLKQRAHQEHEEHERKACNEEACSKTGSGDNHQTILGLYELKWAELKTSDTLQGIVRFHKIPFPMFAHHFSCPAEIMYEAHRSADSLAEQRSSLLVMKTRR